MNTFFGFARHVLFICIITSLSVAPATPLNGQWEKSDDPKIEIVKATFGTGRGSTRCHRQIEQIIQNRDAVTTISTSGLGLRNRSGRFRDLLRIWYRIDGNTIYDENGEEAFLVLKNGLQVNIYEAILAHANERINFGPKPAGESDEPESSPEPSGDPVMEQPSNSDAPPDGAIVIPEFTDKTKEFAQRLATVQVLIVHHAVDGYQFGKVIDLIVQVSESQRPTTEFQRKDRVGETMKIALHEAERAVRVRYPKWEKRDVRFSFSDKYSEKDGGSAGAGFALLLLAVLEGVDLDPDFAVTGDILANWKIKSVGGIPAKVRGAILDKMKIVAIPEESQENVGDVIVKSSVSALWETQIFATADLQSLVALARIDRDDDLQNAISTFATLQQSLQSDGEKLLKRTEVQDQLREILELAPNHLSARYLLAVAGGQTPSRLTRIQSLHDLGVLMQPVNGIIWESIDSDSAPIAESRIEDLQDANDRLAEICHEDISDAVSQFDSYLKALKRVVINPRRPRVEALNRERLEFLEQLRRVSVNREVLENLIRN